MIRRTLLFAASTLLAVSVWAQNAAPASAPSTQAGVSGCMTSDWGRFLITASGSTYDIKGSGFDLTPHMNHMVQIKGLPDTKAANSQTTPFYVLQIQDMGVCGANGTVGTAAPVATPAAQPPATSQPQPDAAPAPVASAATSTQETNGGGTTTSSTPQSSLQTFEGCLAGGNNNYQLKANGKSYKLQGDTTSLNKLEGHTVSVTGEDFNGKAIQVDSARDMGKGCKK